MLIKDSQKVIKGLETSMLLFLKIGKTWPTSNVNGKKPAKDTMQMETMGGRRVRKSKFRKRVALDKQQNTIPDT